MICKVSKPKTEIINCNCHFCGKALQGILEIDIDISFDVPACKKCNKRETKAYIKALNKIAKQKN
jgi:hypothetical protein